MEVDKLVPEAGNLTGFIEQFEVFAGAPGGGGKFRELIFDLATQGKLLRHDNHELTDDKYGTVADYCELVMGQAPPGNECNKDGSGTVFVKTGQFGNRFPVAEEWTTKPLKLAKADDVLICVVGATIGKLNLSIDCAIGRSVAAIRPNNKLLTDFLFYTLMPFTLKLRNNAKGSAQGVIGKKNLNEIVLWVPSLEEQKRIVAKIDELMALCDKLEAQQQQQAQNVLRANTAAINALINPAPQQSENKQKTSESISANTPETPFEQNWQRIAQHFNTLYGCTLPMPKGEGRQKKHLVGLENVKALRQVILSLATSGLLVSQLKSDEPVQKYLDNICDAKKAYKALSRVKKEIVTSIDKKLPELPQGWVWKTFSEVTINRDGERKPLSRTIRENKQGQYDYYGASGVIDHLDEYIFDSPLLLIGEDGANLIARSTPIAFIAKGKYWVNNHAHVVGSFCLPAIEYLCLYINSINLEEYITGMAQPKMNQKKMNSIPVAIPPLEEQKRIVTKVDQLMTLCDQLEQQLTQSYSDAEKLMQATVKALTV